MILIFDTFGGLCNQFYDIYCGINFCIINNIKFSFRYCSFRDNTLINWYNEPFDKLFDMSFLEKYKHLYVNYDILNLTNENTFNFNSAVAYTIFTDNFLIEIMNIDKEYIILKQFWAVYKFKEIKDNVHIQPSARIMDIYNTIKSKIFNTNEQYNFIHYRYEHDFTNYFNVEIENLKSLILKLKSTFKNPNLKIYIATSNIKQLIDLNDVDLCNIVLTKNEDELTNYNFEELAFIDYMFGLNSNEIFGHSKSSFSHAINHSKNTSNYYA